MSLKERTTQIVQRSLYPLTSITIPLLIYAAVLIVGVPTEISLAVRHGFTSILVAIILLFYLLYRQSGWTGTLASLSLTLILFALPLSAMWNSGFSDGSIIGGLLPLNDPNAYSWEAGRLLEGENFTAWGSRRPLFTGMLASLLGLTQQNLQVTLAILVAITAISCFLLAREIQHQHGIAAGILVLTILFLFYRNYIGKLLTENLGLALGAVGFALLWRGAGQKQIDNCLLGILLLTLALNARAGAFFILPAIILWGAWSFRGANRFSLRFLLGGTSIVFLGFILNSILLKFLGSPDAIAFSNFSYVLYGLITGNDWTQVLQDYPALNEMNEAEAAQKIYALVFDVLRTHPFALFTGSFRAWQQFLFEDYIFSFVRNLKANFFLQILSLIALFACYKQRRESNASLMLAVVLGILASVPFVPPWDTDVMRAYAATLPIIAILPALGLAFLTETMEWQSLVKVPKQDNSSQYLLVFSLILTVFVFFSPITTKLFSRASKFASISCQDGTPAVYVRIIPGSFIQLVADDSIRQTHLPKVRLSDFRNRLAPINISAPDLAKELASLNSSTTIAQSLNLINLKQPMIWLIANSFMLPKERQIVGVCGKWSTNLQVQQYAFFYADSIQKVSAISQ